MSPCECRLPAGFSGYQKLNEIMGINFAQFVHQSNRPIIHCISCLGLTYRPRYILLSIKFYVTHICMHTHARTHTHTHTHTPPSPPPPPPPLGPFSLLRKLAMLAPAKKSRSFWKNCACPVYSFNQSQHAIRFAQKPRKRRSEGCK